MNNLIKAIFFDIDGTLVSHAISDIPKGVLESFLQMKKGEFDYFWQQGDTSVNSKIFPCTIIPLMDM